MPLKVDLKAGLSRKEGVSCLLIGMPLREELETAGVSISMNDPIVGDL